jgi:hypothetical protein
MSNIEQAGTFPLGDRTVKRLGYGAMQLAGDNVFGPPRDRDEALRVLRDVIDSGINHIDTAQYYGPGTVNELIREALAPYPDGLAIVSKVAARRDTDHALLRQGIEDNLVTLGTRRLAAVKSGEIKATAINEPTTSQARQEGVNVMIDLAAEQIPWLFSGVVVRRGDLAQPGTIVRFLKAVIEGNHLALTNAPLAKSVLTKELKLTDQTIVDISYDDFKAQSPPNMEPSMKGAENVLAQIGGTGSTALADYVDTGIIDALRTEGFFGTMERKYKTR